MAEATAIEWADSTWNPWIGCTKVSPGCKHCYAETMDKQRFSRTMDGGTKDKPVSHWGKGAPRHRTKDWNKVLKWEKAARWKQQFNRDQFECEAEAYDGAVFTPLPRPRIFPSLCDIWDTEVPIEWLADYLHLVFSTPNLDHLILTKRPEHTLKRLHEARDKCLYGARPWVQQWLDGHPPSNVWIGVSVEDQKRVDDRIPLLLQIPAKVRFLSVEPLLGQVDLTEYFEANNGIKNRTWRALGKGDFVIVGGESGPHRRDCGVEAICDVARQCQAAGVPCFVKQDCALRPGQQGRIPNDLWALKQFPTI